MECPYCKAENRDGVRYCGSCGKLIDANSATPTSGGTAAARSLSPGSRLQGGRYVVKKVLGQGGMGAALLANDLRLDSKLVVIKELISDSADAQRWQEDVRNFKREVATLAHIDHPLIPSVTDHFQEGSHYFMVQEYVDGETLEERLDRTRVPMREREALICASEILDVLEYLAQQTPPIVHRDIKPANIIIGAKDRRAHLVDFGIARAEVARNAQRKQTSALGTPGYAPPEQYQGNADPRSDLYALAATLHHLLTNRDPRNHPPFSYPLVRVINSQLSPEIEQVLQRTLANDINQRYQSAAAMKEDIDDILRKRFGISGNINSYTLGMSGAMTAVGAANTTVAASAGANAYPPSIVTNPVTPLPTSGPGVPPPPFVVPGSYGQQPSSKKKSRGWLVVLVLLVLLVLCSGGAFAAARYLNLFPLGNGGGGGGTDTGIGVSSVGNESIGISDGTFTFDTARPDDNLKQQAAQKLKQSSSDTGAAMSLLNQAIAQESNDAEAHIYLENLRVLSSGSPYVTVVVGTMLSGDSTLIGVGRDSLQGAYIAQKEFNDGAKLHNGTQVRLLIANTGSKTDSASQVAQQIVKLAQHDKTFVGVMGMPYSSRSLAAIKVLGNAHIPMVSQTSSSDLLTNVSPYFFRVAPSNKTQGILGSQYAQQTLNAKKVVLFVDSADPYSQSLGQDFATQFKADGGTILATEKYTVGKASTISANVQDALSNNPDLIYFAGYANDVSVLLANLPTSGNLKVMGGDALYELGGYPSSARANFSRLHFTAFAYPDQWGILGHGADQPAFFTEYPAAFAPAGHEGNPYGFTRADNDAMLSYDAMVAMLKGCDLALASGKKSITPQDLQQGLLAINGSNAFQGVSGRIEFGQGGDPVDKAIVILYVDPEGHIKMEPRELGRFFK